MSKCKIAGCGKRVYWKILIREDVCGEIMDRVDREGEMSLTEGEQMIYHSEVCVRHARNLPPYGQ